MQRLSWTDTQVVCTFGAEAVNAPEDAACLYGRFISNSFSRSTPWLPQSFRPTPVSLRS